MFATLIECNCKRLCQTTVLILTSSGRPWQKRSNGETQILLDIAKNTSSRLFINFVEDLDFVRTNGITNSGDNAQLKNANMQISFVFGCCFQKMLGMDPSRSSTNKEPMHHHVAAAAKWSLDSKESPFPTDELLSLSRARRGPGHLRGRTAFPVLNEKPLGASLSAVAIDLLDSKESSFPTEEPLYTWLLAYTTPSKKLVLSFERR